jgi:uncharacterized protein YecE (DUF72 family)
MASGPLLRLPFAARTSMSDLDDSPGPRIAVGCAELPPGMSRTAYFRRLPFLEMRLPGDRAPAPRVAERWREEAGPGQLALVAPRALCSFHRPGGPGADELARSADQLAEVASRARAAAVVFITPPDLSPSSANRDRLQEFFRAVAGADRFGGDGAPLRIWQPDGLWRPASAAAFADELGIVPAVDPLAGDPLEEGIPAPGPIAYARVTGLGRPSRPLGTDDLERIVEWAGPSQQAFIALATLSRLSDATALWRALG